MGELLGFNCSAISETFTFSGKTLSSKYTILDTKSIQKLASFNLFSGKHASILIHSPPQIDIFPSSSKQAFIRSINDINPNGKEIVNGGSIMKSCEIGVMTHSDIPRSMTSPDDFPDEKRAEIEDGKKCIDEMSK